MKKEIKKLIIDIEEFEISANATLATQKSQFNEKSRKFINKFLVDFQLLITDLNKYNNELYAALNENVSHITVKDDLSKLLVIMSSKLSTEKSNVNTTQENLIISSLQNLIKIKTNLRIILKKLKVNNQSFFNDENIDKKEIVSYLEKAMLSFEKEAENITSKEKEKVIVYFKETIKEVQKPKTAWDKVAGSIAILSALVTLYVSSPDAVSKLKSDLHGALGTITKEMKIEANPNSIPDNLILDAVKETGSITI